MRCALGPPLNLGVGQHTEAAGKHGSYFRVGRGFVHLGGEGAVAMLFTFAFLSRFVRILLLVVCALVVIIAFFRVIYTRQARTK